MKKGGVVFVIVATVATFSLIGMPTPRARAIAPTFAPCCLQLTVASSAEIDLSWTGIDVVNSGINGYRIERESPVGGGFTMIIANSGSTATTYSNTNLSPGVTYNYRVSEINSDGVSPPSSPAAATTPTTVGTANVSPGPPKNLTAVAVSPTEIDLSWTSPQSSTAITGYRLEREITIGGGFTTLLNTTSTATTYADINLSPGVIYNYRVYAFSIYGPSVSSQNAYATTPIQPQPPRNAVAVAGNAQAIITWQPPLFTGGGLTGYLVSYASGTYPITLTIGGNATGTTITGLTNGTLYYFGISAFNSAGTSSAILTNTIVPSASSPQPAPTATPPASGATSTASSKQFIFSYLLVVGTRGTTVWELQKRLATEGFYSGPVTGYFGQLTKAAVQRYQKAHNILTTGMLGPLTRASLNSGR